MIKEMIKEMIKKDIKEAIKVIVEVHHHLAQVVQVDENLFIIEKNYINELF